MTDVKAWLTTAHQHVASARLLVGSDTIDVDLVIEACHQAVRMAIWADRCTTRALASGGGLAEGAERVRLRQPNNASAHGP